MSITAIRSGAFSTSGSGPGLAARARRWLRQRRQAAVLRQIEPRLREDAGLPMGSAVANLAVARFQAMPGG
jgi:hypothetical protein